MSCSTGDYQAWNVEEAEPVYSILVYNFWESMSATPPMEPNFRRGLPTNAPIDPLVWGGLYSESYQALKDFDRVQWSNILYCLGFLLSAGVVPNFLGVNDTVVLAVGLCLFGIGFLVHFFCVRKLNRDMRVVVETVNPILANAGYRVTYAIEPTGICYSKEHRFHIFHTPKGPSVFDVLPRTNVPKPLEPVKVYMHAPWYRHFFLWKCDMKRHVFFYDKQPESLKSIHPYLYGSLCDSFHSYEMEELRNKRTRVVNGLVFLAIFTFFAIRDNRPWWIPVGLLLIAAVVSFFVFEHFLTKTSRRIGHDKWVEAASHTWRRVMDRLGWNLEYHHKDESDDALRTKILGGAPSDFVRFVPVGP